MPAVLKSESMTVNPDRRTLVQMYQVTEAETIFSAEAQVPDIGSLYPGSGSLVVTNIRTKDVEFGSTWDVEVEYENISGSPDSLPPDSGAVIIEVSGNGASTQTFKDVDGQDIQVFHEQLTADPAQIEEIVGNLLGSEAGEVVENALEQLEARGIAIPRVSVPIPQRQSVEKIVPSVVWRVTERVGGLNVVSEAQNIVGTIDASHHWLCTRVDARSEDGGETYVVTYEYQFNPETWDVTVEWTDPETRKAPPDLVEGEGRQTFQIYPQGTHPNGPS